MRYLLEKANEALAGAGRSLVAGEYKDARFKYLQAAEYLFRAAGRSLGELKESRTEAAWRIRELVERLDRQIEVEGSRRKHQAPDSSTPAADGRDGSGNGNGRKPPLSTSDDVAGSPANWRREACTGIGFGDVAGLENVKQEVMLNFVYPARFPEDAKTYGVARGGGLLLYGPPGTGKTLIARAIAGEVDAVLYVVSAADIMSKWVGEAEQRVQALFADARRQRQSVIFIDEIESLLPRRKSNQSTVMARVIPQLLAELDGFDGRGTPLLFIGATNEPWALDSAAMRPGRFDTLVHVPLPDRMARRRIFEINLTGLAVAPGVRLDELADMTGGWSGADIRRICSIAGRAAFEEKILGGDARLIERIDFTRAIQETPPSVKPEQAESYRRFAGAHAGQPQ